MRPGGNDMFRESRKGPKFDWDLEEDDSVEKKVQEVENIDLHFSQNMK